MLIDNLNQIRYRMRAAALRAHRDPDAVRLVAVTKYASPESVRALIETGLVSEVGENRVQDAEKRKQALGALAARVRWRLIGHLQTNKARKAAALFDAVDSVDSEKVAEALETARGDAATPLPVMVQVKLTARETQAGVGPSEVGALIAALKSRAKLEVEGLMGLAPAVANADEARPAFRALRELRDRHLPGGLLSMGMSRDFEVAIEEGADLVRIGSLIFPQPSPASLEAQA